MKLQLKYYKLFKIVMGLLLISSNIFCQENLTSDLKYFAEDSIIYDLTNNKVLLYNNAKVNYALNMGKGHQKQIPSYLLHF